MTTVTIGDKEVFVAERTSTTDIVDSVNRYLEAVEALKQSKQAQQLRSRIVSYSAGVVSGAALALLVVGR